MPPDPGLGRFDHFHRPPSCAPSPRRATYVRAACSAKAGPVRVLFIAAILLASGVECSGCGVASGGGPGPPTAEGSNWDATTRPRDAGHVPFGVPLAGTKPGILPGSRPGCKPRRSGRNDTDGETPTRKTAAER